MLFKDPVKLKEYKRRYYLVNLQLLSPAENLSKGNQYV
jgi:hypothetical protein